MRSRSREENGNKQKRETERAVLGPSNIIEYRSLYNHRRLKQQFFCISFFGGRYVGRIMRMTNIAQVAPAGFDR